MFWVDPDLKEVVIDVMAIQRCILNLISNAIDACNEKEKGTVKVSTKLWKNKRNFKISISDNGKGIKKKNIEKIFQIFFSTKGIKGTGLGLAVTQKIIQEHNVKIKVNSTLGKGTTFSVTLPFTEVNLNFQDGA